MKKPNIVLEDITQIKMVDNTDEKNECSYCDDPIKDRTIKLLLLEEKEEGNTCICEVCMLQMANNITEDGIIEIPIHYNGSVDKIDLTATTTTETVDDRFKKVFDNGN